MPQVIDLTNIIKAYLNTRACKRHLVKSSQSCLCKFLSYTEQNVIEIFAVEREQSSWKGKLPEKGEEPDLSVQQGRVGRERERTDREGAFQCG